MEHRWLGSLLADREARKLEQREYFARQQLRTWDRFLYCLLIGAPRLLRYLSAQHEARALRRWHYYWEVECDRHKARQEAAESMAARLRLLEDEPTKQSQIVVIPREPDSTPTPVRPLPKLTDNS